MADSSDTRNGGFRDNKSFTSSLKKVNFKNIILNLKYFILKLLLIFFNKYMIYNSL